ncbi:SDR family NAD(P)-dependent oxidoreductase [Variovorax boronicumulans]|uniref:SDR family NAD(P)-dependent oxidoreductase n=1 Tax=Variovorax boronicumulans TaxID=436515 RepID=UPI001C597007
MDLNIEGKVAIVTGAGSGIGACVARTLAREGASVAVVEVDAAKAQAVVAELQAAGHRALAVAVDVTDPQSVQAMAAQVIERLGGIHILVNNAGFTRDMHLVKMSEQAWDSVVDVIMKGAFLCTRAVMPWMIENQGGRVINISSRAHLGNPGQANYSAAKAGLLGFTRALALEEGRYNITVNAVAPGIIDTEAVRSLPHFEKLRAAAEKTTPIPRIGDTSDVADAVAFLASARASYITGEVLHVTGGRY